MAKKDAAPATLQLTKEERLEVQLLNVQRDNIQLQASQQLEKVGQQMAMLGQTITQRLGGGIDITKYRIDFNTGLATLMDQQPQQDAPSMADMPPADQMPS